MSQFLYCFSFWRYIFLPISEYLKKIDWRINYLFLKSLYQQSEMRVFGSNTRSMSSEKNQGSTYNCLGEISKHFLKECFSTEKQFFLQKWVCQLCKWNHLLKQQPLVTLNIKHYEIQTRNDHFGRDEYNLCDRSITHL